MERQEEVIIGVKKGVNVTIKEDFEGFNDPRIRDKGRDVVIAAPSDLKLAISRAEENKPLSAAGALITMCG